MSHGEECSLLYDLQETQLHRYMVESPAVILIPITIDNVKLTKLIMSLIGLSLLELLPNTIHLDTQARLNDSCSASCSR